MNRIDPAVLERSLTAAGIELAPESGAPAPETARHSPWYLRLLAGIGGFIGGLMVLMMFGSILAMARIFESAAGATSIGMMLCVGAVVIYRSAQGSAAGAQAGLAASVAGQIAISFGIMQWFKFDGQIQWWPLVLGQGVLVWLIRDGLHRSLVTATMVILGALSCRADWQLAAWWGIACLAVVWWLASEAPLIMRGWADAVSPIAFGTLAGVLLSQWPWPFVGYLRHGASAGIPVHWVAALPALLLAVWWHTRANRPAPRAAAIALALVAGVLGVWLPVWTTAILLAMLGVASARPGWAVIAVLAMGWSVSRYYYVMKISLLEKAGSMALAGLVCLGLALLVRRIGPSLIGGLDEQGEAA